MSLILFVGFALLVLLPAAPLIVWVLKPILLSWQKQRRPFRYSLSDLFTLMVMCQLPMLLFANLVWDAPLGVKATIVGLLFIAMGILWVRGVRLLTDAGISNRAYRFLFLAVILPATFVGAVLVGIIAIVFFTAIFWLPSADTPFALLLAGAEIALIAVLYLGRRSIKSMMATASVRKRCLTPFLSKHEAEKGV